MTLDFQNGERSFLYQRLTKEDCNMRSRGKRQKEHVDGFFTHTKILSETSAPLEIVSRLLGMKLEWFLSSMNMLPAAFKSRNF